MGEVYTRCRCINRGVCESIFHSNFGHGCGRLTGLKKVRVKVFSLCTVCDVSCDVPTSSISTGYTSSAFFYAFLCVAPSLRVL